MFDIGAASSHPMEGKKMRNVNINICNFDELPVQIQAKVIDRYRDMLTDLLDDDLKGDMEWKLNGYVGGLDFELSYSLGYCQGDGVSFTGSVEGKEELLTLAGLVYDNKIPKNISRLIEWNIIYEVEFARCNYHYVHEYSVQVNIIENYNITKDYLHISKAMAEFETAIDKWRLQICDTLETFGYDTIEILYGDDNIKSFIAENDFEFFSDGRDCNIC